MSTIAERVTKGAALLDERTPGWWKKDAPHPIDLVALDLDDCERCVLGQAFEEGEDHDNYCSYDAGIGFLNLTHPGSPDTYGFDGGFDETRDLTAEWKRVITERRTVVTA